MKMIEIVMLLGSQCVSPLEHTGTATEVSKVQCAVVIEKDSEAGTLRIVPAGASSTPEVVAVLKRMEGDGTKIEPAAAAPPDASARVQEVKPPAAEPPQEMAETKAQAAPEPVKPKTAEVAKPVEAKPAKTKAVKAAEAPKDKVASKCLGAAQPKWYKTADGHRKYRCVLPG